MKTDTWEKVHVFDGDPYRVSAATHQTIYKSPDVRVRRFDRTDDVQTLHGAIRAFKMTSCPIFIVLNRPTAEQLKALQKSLENDSITADGVVVSYASDYADGRSSFVKEATKKKRVFTFDYIQEGDRAPLFKYLMDWKKASGVKLTANGADWLLKNLPVSAEQIKTDKGKREAQVYSLATMFSDLNKIGAYSVSNNVEVGVQELKDLCSFSRSFDLWKWVDAAARGDSCTLFEQTDRMIDEDISPHGPLHILNGQLTLAIQVKQLTKEGVYDHFDIQSRCNAKEYGSQFWTWNDDVPETSSAPPSPYRIKRIQEFTAKQSLESLSRRIILLSKTISDLRSGLPQTLVLKRFILAISV